MKGVLDLLRRSESQKNNPEHQDSVFFSTAFADHQGVDSTLLVPWEARAAEVGAKRMGAGKGVKRMQALWAKDKYMSRLDAASIERLERFFDFATIAPERDLIRQDEYGDFMVVLLNGTIAVDRVQPWGEHMRLTEARPGDVLGEMSLLDGGMRFSMCVTLVECEIAVLSAQGLDEMMNADPMLAAGLIALLARKLSMRLRVVGARLSDRQNP